MKNKITIALAGNPNSGKTTLFNALTGASQYVGNWPGVTVEQKSGRVRKHDNVEVVDLPGIYSLSPYTLEEVIARDYLIDEKPDVILNIVDGTNLERNLYLSTQLLEVGIPMIIAVNLMDVVRKNQDHIDLDKLSEELGCKVLAISALKEEGIEEAIQACIQAAGKDIPPRHLFSGPVEHALAHIEEAVLHDLPLEEQRWYAIKIFERDEKVLDKLAISPEILKHIEQDIAAAEEELDDDAEALITNERYTYIAQILALSYRKKSQGQLSTSDKIDKIVTNRWLALPIFAAIMTLVFYITVSTVGTWATDWANDGLFGDGWHLFGIGTGEYEEAIDEYAAEHIFTKELKDMVRKADEADVVGAAELEEAVEDGSFADFEEAYKAYGPVLLEAGYGLDHIVDPALESEDLPATENFGIWVPGIPVLFEGGLDSLNASEGVKSLVLDGIVSGVGAVLGFVPQMIVLFLLLGFLELSGYMARVAFILDRIFRKFGLSGKSFIPMLISIGCGVPGIMASRTIENERDRRMTIMTTTFMPCGAKLPIIIMVATALFHAAWWFTPLAYFIGIAAIIVSGIMLKKTDRFAGEPAPFVMELPEYRMPQISSILLRMWERVRSFIIRAGTVIFISSIIIWAGSNFGWVDGAFGFSTEMELDNSVLGRIGNAVAFIFAPLGFDNATATVATVMGLVAKEEVVAVFGVMDFVAMTQLAAFSFLIFNLLCAPCFAAIGAMKREMNNAKWTAFALAYQTFFAYGVALIIYQFGSALQGQPKPFWLAISVLILAGTIYQLFRPYHESQKAYHAR
ncbi:MAG: ferrous iron transporter B [Eubacteriales bacterium]|nr:ferrous iron transporter B [Clostridiales bacterium]MDY5836492.1 ferrous iron transporter B [Eubacteriales bacterium]